MTRAWGWQVVSDSSIAVSLRQDTYTNLPPDYFTKNIDRTWRLLENLEAGMIGMNTGNASAAETPFGGIKESGYGKESGKDVAIAEYMVSRLPNRAFGGINTDCFSLDHQDRHADPGRSLLRSQHRNRKVDWMRRSRSVLSSRMPCMQSQWRIIVNQSIHVIYHTWIVPLHIPSTSSNLLLTVVKFSHPSSLTTTSSSILTPPTLQ
jgi:hypothetical protein